MKASRVVKLHPVQYEAQHDKVFVNYEGVTCMHYKGYYVENCSSKTKADKLINSYNK
jgi:hypothetical protein